MKTFTLILFTLILSTASAQCDFNPVISPEGENGVIMMCPPSDSTMTLSTIEGDSYQWYMRPMFSSENWQAIPGGTEQELVIDYYNYVVYDIKVAVTIGACTEESPVVGIDGWTFLLPSLMTEFATEEYQQIGDSEYNVCTGNVITLTANMPYTQNMSWFLDGSLIANQTQPVLQLSESGSYSFDGCTDVCPDYCAVSSGFGVPPIQFNYGNWEFCSLATNDMASAGKLQIYPNPAQSIIQMQLPDTVQNSDLEIFSAEGKVVLKLQNYSSGNPLDISSIPSGKYFIKITANGKTLHSSFIKK